MVDALHLDIWVFTKVKELFAEASRNTTLNAILRQDKNVFFLHLLGLDMNGHAFRPYSKEYLSNIKVVDQGVQEITKLIEGFYGDGKTAFVFTADHGMSNWGSHGDGHPDNTRTPLIAWGSGVAKPKIFQRDKAPGHEDGFSSDWGLDRVQRHDVAQADVAALMAYLAGLEFPVNSVGELPLPYLAANDREKAEAALVNAREVLEMYRVKEDFKKATQLKYKPFPPLGDEQHSVEHRVSDIRQVIARGEYEQAMRMSQELLKVGLEGLRYLQTYDWLFLRVLVSLGYLGWIAFSATTVIDLHLLQRSSQASRTVFTLGAFGAIAISLVSVMVMQKAPFMYYAYAAFPLGFWEEVVARREALVHGGRHLLRNINTSHDYLTLFLQALAFLGVLEALVSVLAPLVSLLTLLRCYHMLIGQCIRSALLWHLSGLSSMAAHLLDKIKYWLRLGLLLVNAWPFSRYFQR